MIQPIQDRVYDAVKEVAGTSYVAVFDLGGQASNLLFASEKYDKSDSVLRKLGIRPGKEGEQRRYGKDDEEFGEPPPDDAPKDGGRTQRPTGPTKGRPGQKNPNEDHLNEEPRYSPFVTGA